MYSHLFSTARQFGIVSSPQNPLAFLSLFTAFQETVAFGDLFLISEVNCSHVNGQIRYKVTILTNKRLVVLRSLIFSREILNNDPDLLDLLTLLIDVLQLKNGIGLLANN